MDLIRTESIFLFWKIEYFKRTLSTEEYMHLKLILIFSSSLLACKLFQQNAAKEMWKH